MRHLLWIGALAALVLSGCRYIPGKGLPVEKRAPFVAAAPPSSCGRSEILRLDRGDWMVNRGSRVWKVMVARAGNRPPEHIGYVVEQRYRQMRGGPPFKIYNVTRLDRNEQIGHIDQLGRGIRYEPTRNGTFQEIGIGTNTRELNVAAIFETTDRVTLQATNERQLAFESLDVNGDGVLQAQETRRFGDRVFGADTNGDGVVDFNEFNAVDRL